jgi:uncharacterized protein involved in exopolysaccharide biosynthesis
MVLAVQNRGLVRSQQNRLYSENPVLELPGATARSTFSEEHREPLVLEYWRLLLRRRWTVLGVIAAFLALATLYSLTMTPLYKATGRISVEKQDLNALGFKGDHGPIDVMEYNMQLDAQEKLLTSDTLVLKALRTLNDISNASVTLTEPPSSQPMSKEELGLLRQTQSRLEVSRVGHTPLIEISFADP